MSAASPAHRHLLALFLLGFVLMFVGHLLAFVGWSVAGDGGPHLPYWWSYPVIYPAAGVLVRRLTTIRPWQAAGWLAAPPVLYFLQLGVLGGAWGASDHALAGSAATLILIGAVLTFVPQRRRTETP